MTTHREQIKAEIPGQAKSGWTTIYRFPYVGIISALNRTKWYQLGATLLGSPVVYAVELAGNVGSGTALICLSVGLSATVATTAFSKVSSGTVGFFYLNQDETVARFGYVDSNGGRKDVLSSVEKLTAKGENKLFIRISVEDEDKELPSHNLKLFHSHGIISDVGKFNQVL